MCHSRHTDRLHGRNGAGASGSDEGSAASRHCACEGEWGARAYRGRKPSYSRKEFESAQAMLGKSASVGEVARDTGLTRQTVYRMKADPVGAEAALATWEL